MLVAITKRLAGAERFGRSAEVLGAPSARTRGRSLSPHTPRVTRARAALERQRQSERTPARGGKIHLAGSEISRSAGANAHVSKYRTLLLRALRAPPGHGGLWSSEDGKERRRDQLRIQDLGSKSRSRGEQREESRRTGRLWGYSARCWSWELQSSILREQPDQGQLRKGSSRTRRNETTRKAARAESAMFLVSGMRTTTSRHIDAYLKTTTERRSRPRSWLSR